MKKQIKKSKLILVEGTNDVQFFEAVLRYLHLDAQVEAVGGKPNFATQLTLFQQDANFSMLTHLVLVRDADQSASSAFQSLHDLVKKNGHTPPKKRNTFSENTPLSVGIFIVGKAGTEEGALEDFCMQSVENHKVMPCVDAFLDCLQTHDFSPKNLSKTRTQVFLAAMPEVSESLGLAAAKGYLDFGTPNMHELIDFLKIMPS